MPNETVTTIQAESPEMEARRLALIDAVKAQIDQKLGVLPPGYEVADLSDDQLRAITLAGEGIGAYEPFISGGSDAITAGTGAITGAGMGAYEKASELIDPSAIAQYFNPFEQQVVDQTLADLARQSDIQGVTDRARAAGAGAFGGSRMGVQEAERSGRLFDASARTAGALRQQGYTQAAQLAQNAAQLQGMVGAGIGSLGSQLGDLRIKQAGLGELATRLNTQDMQNMLTVGGLQQDQQQKELEAARLTNTQNYYQPLNLYSTYSDILSQTPSGMQTVSASTSPNTPWWQSVLGGGIAAGAGIAGWNQLQGTTGGASGGLL